MAETSGRFRLDAGTLFQVIVYVITLTLAYSALDKRITTLEIKYDRIAQDLAEIKSDVKALLAR